MDRKFARKCARKIARNGENAIESPPRTLPKAKNVPVSDLREVDFFGRGEKYRHVVPDDSHEECDGHDGQEHPQPDCGVEAELGIRHFDAVRGDLVGCGPLWLFRFCRYSLDIFTQIVFRLSCLSCHFNRCIFQFPNHARLSLECNTRTWLQTNILKEALKQF